MAGQHKQGQKKKQGNAKQKGPKKNRKRKHEESSESEDGFEEVTLGHPTQVGQNVMAGIGMEDSDTEEQNTRKLVQQQNRKKKKSGGFQSMGLSHAVFTGIMRKGYKIPTPIQRKTIPVIMDGKDMVAMARTGSGKTAAFLIPLFERLKVHSAQSGARALILSPTRELAIQTLKFTKELGKYTSLKSVVILGGDKIEDQFAAMHENPDIIIATPGRFMHVLVEMGLKLSQVEYIVFDEADRLFEMGFQEQLQEILDRVPESRQTLLFSATLPKLLVEFAKAGLQDPTLIRLDVDTKLSDQLKLSFLQCRQDNKTAVLLHLLRNVIKPSDQTVVFVATKHHVEFLNMVLLEAGITCSYTYSSLDQTARKIHVAKFRNKMTNVLLVTDLAARGIDIPTLDNVINFNFPAKPKLFVHRVGRVARAGRSGMAYSIVSPDEVSYVLDLHLFLGRPLKPVVLKDQKDEDGLYGRVPQIIIDDEDVNLQIWLGKTDISNMRRVTDNAQKHYIRSRPPASSESIKRTKELNATMLQYHPVFDISGSGEMDDKRLDFLENVQSYIPHTTIFEIKANKRKAGFLIMKEKRRCDQKVVGATRHQREEKKNSMLESSATSASTADTSDSELKDAFSTVIAPKFNSTFETRPKKRKRKHQIVDENYLHYKPKGFHSEKGLSLGTSFEKQMSHATFDVSGDDNQNNKKMTNALTWDRKKKKYIRETGSDPKRKKVKTESGNWIPASYKTNMYKEWLDRNQTAVESGSEDDGDAKNGKQRSRKGHLRGQGKRGRGGRGGSQRKSPAGKEPGGRKPKRHEMKSADQILKQRRKTAATQHFQKARAEKKPRGGKSKGRGR